MVTAWVKLIWHSVTAAVVAAAAQLGIADTLGIIRWTDTVDAGGGSNGWSATLTWVGFSYAVAVLVGAGAGRRGAQRSGRADTVGWRVTGAVAACVGAAAAVSLVWLMARDSAAPVSGDPQLIVTLTAGAGVVAGLVLALLAMSAPPIAAGVRATVGWVWLVGIASAAAGLAANRAHPAPRLAVVDAPSLITVDWWSGPYVMVALSALFGFAVAGVARWGGARRFSTVMSGLGGPAVVAAAYVIAGPGSGGDRTGQLEPYQASLVAVGAGLCAAALVALPRSPAARGRPSAPSQSRHEQRPREPRHAPDPYAWSAQLDTVERPLVATSAQHTSAQHTSAATQAPHNLPHATATHAAVAHAAVPSGAAPPAPAAPAIMGQPPRPYSDDYSDWLKELGQVSTRPNRDGPRG